LLKTSTVSTALLYHCFQNFFTEISLKIRICSERQWRWTEYWRIWEENRVNTFKCNELPRLHRFSHSLFSPWFSVTNRTRRQWRGINIYTGHALTILHIPSYLH